jgi:hypothetical protein
LCILGGPEARIKRERNLYLSEETPFRIKGPDQFGSPVKADGREPVSWATLGLTVIPRLALAVSAGSRVIFNPVKVSVGDVGFITFGPTLREAIPDDLKMIVGCQFDDGSIQTEREDSEIQLFIGRIPRVDPQQPWTEIEFPLDRAVERIVSFYVECTAASKPGHPQSKLGVYEFVISDKGSLELNRNKLGSGNGN